jgi:hypothetical protein
MIDQTLEHLMEQIEDRRKDIIESLGDGAAKTFEDYKHAVGMVRGLLTAQSLIADLAKRMENSDE